MASPETIASEIRQKEYTSDATAAAYIDFTLVATLASRGHDLEIKASADNPWVRTVVIGDIDVNKLEAEYRYLQGSKEYEALQKTTQGIIPDEKIFPEDKRLGVIIWAARWASRWAEKRGRCGVVGTVYDSEDSYTLGFSRGILAFASRAGHEALEFQDFVDIFSGVLERHDQQEADIQRRIVVASLRS